MLVIIQQNHKGPFRQPNLRDIQLKKNVCFLDFFFRIMISFFLHSSHFYSFSRISQIYVNNLNFHEWNICDSEDFISHRRNIIPYIFNHKLETSSSILLFIIAWLNSNFFCCKRLNLNHSVVRKIRSGTHAEKPNVQV